MFEVLVVDYNVLFVGDECSVLFYGFDYEDVCLEVEVRVFF